MCMSELEITVWLKLPPFRNSLADVLGTHHSLGDSPLCPTPALCSSLSSHSALCTGGRSEQVSLRGLWLPGPTHSLGLLVSCVFVVFSRKTGVSSLLFRYLNLTNSFFPWILMVCLLFGVHLCCFYSKNYILSCTNSFFLRECVSSNY